MASPIRIAIARPRLLLAVVTGVLVAALIPSTVAGVTRTLIGWNIAIWLYLALLAHVIRNATHDVIARHASEQDEGRRVILSGSVLAASASVGSIVALLATSRNVVGLEQAWHLALAFTTIVSAWIFVHVCFAMHYAHIYYDAAQARKGLVFPGANDSLPDYEDFLYFALTIGMTSQTSDVTVTTKPMRRLVLLHSVMSFFFNTAVLALTINIAASLI